MRDLSRILLAGLFLSPFPAAAAGAGAPSRAAVKGCAWEKLADEAVGLEAWVQRCDFGFRKIDLLFAEGSLAIRYSDGGGKPEPLIDVLPLQSGESPEAGVRRHFAARTEPRLAGRCVMVRYKGEKPPPGVKRYTFVPDAAFQKELDAKGEPDGVPDPPCGDWGDAPDGIQYFETHPKSGVPKILFVRVGQDEPLFDEKTLRLLPKR